MLATLLRRGLIAALALCALGPARAQDDPAAVHPALEQLAERNARLVATIDGPDGLTAKIEAATDKLEKTRSDLERVRRELATAQEQVAAHGASRAGGLLMGARQGRLPSVTALGTSILRRSGSLRDAQVDEQRLVSERLRLTEQFETTLDATLEALRPAPAPAAREQVRAEIRRLLEERLPLLDRAIDAGDRYIRTLLDLDESERLLLAEALRYEGFLNEISLWVPTFRILSLGDFVEAGKLVPWLLDPLAWARTVPAVLYFATERPGPVALVTLLLLGLVFARLGFRLHASTGLRDQIGRALAFTVFPAAVTWAAGWILSAPPEAPPVARHAGQGLLQIATLVLVVESVRAVCRRGGLAETVLGWAPERCTALRRACRWLALLFLPLATITLAALSLFRQSGEPWAESAGRVALLFSIVVLFGAAREVARPGAGVFEGTDAAPGWVVRLRPVGRWAAVGFPAVLLFLVVLGYVRAAGALIGAVFESFGLALGALLILGVARWWLGSEPERLAAARRVRTVVALAFAFGLWVVWSDVLPALGYLTTIRLWSVASPEGPAWVTAGSLVWFVALVLLTVVGTRVVPGLVELLLRRLPLDASLRYAAGMLAQYVIVIVGIIGAFSALKIGWSKLQWLVAGLSVGLGFGLQEIVANFVSGLIILFERPVRIGDVVTVGETTGTVTRIRVRSTTIRDPDRKELIVPNKELITSRVTNWDLSDRVTRIQLSVGVAYGSDTAKVTELLVRCAATCPLVLAEPRPQAVFSEFGDNALGFRLYAFVSSRDVLLDARHALNTEIDRAFREAGIEISFPQRDVHLDTRGPLTVRVEGR